MEEQQSKRMEIKRNWLIVIGILIAAVVIEMLISGESTKRYVGSNSEYEVVVELYSDGTFMMKDTEFRTGLSTEAAGTYELLGENENVVRFTFNNNVVCTCQIMVNIYGTPFISFAGVFSKYPACYLE